MSKSLTVEDVSGIVSRYVRVDRHLIDVQIGHVDFSEDTKQWTVEAIAKNKKLWVDLTSDGKVLKASRFLGEPSLSMWDVLFLCLAVLYGGLVAYSLKPLALGAAIAAFLVALVAPTYLKDTIDMSGNFARVRVPSIRIVRVAITVGILLVWIFKTRG